MVESLGATLYESCRSTNQRVRNQAYEDLGRRLYRIAYKFCVDSGYPPQVAQDCVQEALISVYRSIETVQQPAAFLGFATRILRNQCLHVFKQQHDRREVQLGSPDGGEDGEDFAEHILARGDAATDLFDLVRYELLECVRTALERLPERQRLVLTLKFFALWSDEQIAERLGTSVGNVHVLRFKARALLRQDRLLADCMER